MSRLNEQYIADVGSMVAEEEGSGSSFPETGGGGGNGNETGGGGGNGNDDDDDDDDDANDGFDAGIPSSPEHQPLSPEHLAEAVEEVVFEAAQTLEAEDSMDLVDIAQSSQSSQPTPSRTPRTPQSSRKSDRLLSRTARRFTGVFGRAQVSPAQEEVAPVSPAQEEVGTAIAQSTRSNHLTQFHQID